MCCTDSCNYGCERALQEFNCMYNISDLLQRTNFVNSPPQPLYSASLGEGVFAGFICCCTTARTRVG